MNYTANHFCQALKLDPAQVNLVTNEQILMQGLKFDLHVHTPLASIEALVKLLSLQNELQVQHTALNFCLNSYKTREVFFCNSPSIVAIAAVQYAINQASLEVNIVTKLGLDVDSARVQEIIRQVSDSTAQAKETHEKAK